MKKKIKQFFFTPWLAICAALILTFTFCLYAICFPFAIRAGAMGELNEACGDLVKTVGKDIKNHYQ
ncbi:hypothetical protein [Vibrio harveyi]|uniref:hypothetical protein n=1 Tax=Vibrio harveyi TaxID=669 RepID=UPI00217DEA6A|nr:hypothetical protein [Vibrio harveyi]